jgi:hypothetical protein
MVACVLSQEGGEGGKFFFKFTKGMTKNIRFYIMLVG